jgi:hypothetical protein
MVAGLVDGSVALVTATCVRLSSTGLSYMSRLVAFAACALIVVVANELSLLPSTVNSRFHTIGLRS